MNDVTELYMPDSGECFTFHDGDKNETYVFAVCLMNQFIEKEGDSCHLIKLKTQPIEPPHVENTRRNKGIEQDRLDRLVEPYLSKPCIGALWTPEGGINIVDGHHRIIKRHDMGLKTFDVWIFHPLIWRQFLLDMPGAKDRMSGPSGMIEHEQRNYRDDR